MMPDDGNLIPDQKERFSQACAYVMPFGMHKGLTLARIGASDEGLKYLDWMIGQDRLGGRVHEEIQTYLRHPAIAQRLDSILDD